MNQQKQSYIRTDLQLKTAEATKENKAGKELCTARLSKAMVL
jgi:hypothetical protein